MGLDSSSHCCSDTGTVVGLTLYRYNGGSHVIQVQWYIHIDNFSPYFLRINKFMVKKIENCAAINWKIHP